MHTKFWSDKLEKSEFLKRLNVDEIVILILIHILKKYIEALYTNQSFHFRWCPGSMYLFTIFFVMIVLKTFRSVSVKTVQRLYSVININIGSELEIKLLKTQMNRHKIVWTTWLERPIRNSEQILRCNPEGRGRPREKQNIWSGSSLAAYSTGHKTFSFTTQNLESQHLCSIHSKSEGYRGLSLRSDPRFGNTWPIPSSEDEEE